MIFPQSKFISQTQRH